MFETATFSYGPSNNRVWTTAMGFTGQAVLIGCALLAPLLSPQTLGRAFLVTGLVAPGAPTAPVPPGPRVEPVPRGAAAKPTYTNLFNEPVPAHIPAIAAMIVDPPDTSVSGPASRFGVPGGDPNAAPSNDPNSLIRNIVGMVPVVHPPVVERPPVTVAAAPAKPPRITVIRMATPIYKVDPIYPHLAKVAGVSGVVELLGVLGTDGRIHELKVLRGHPLLVGAALDAVRQWIFEPTLLNGQAVEVAAPITVNFILKR
jgi:protein TonB